MERIDKTIVGNNISPERSDTDPLLVAVTQFRAFLAELGPQFNEELQRLGQLQERLESERFHLAVLGQFKRGKSTLLNALLGDDLLPTSVVPLTAIPTFLFYGTDTRARVVFQGDRAPENVIAEDTRELTDFLSNFVTEEGNPENVKHVSYVEVYYPSELLRTGVVLIDTPGIGSTCHHNTELTLNFLPQCDAALFLISSDPPITEVEVSFLKAARERIHRLFFIVNKVDYLAEEEKETFIRFLRTVLHEQADLEEDVPILLASARQGIKARKAGDGDLWAASGLDIVTDNLIQFLVKQKRSTLRKSMATKANDIVAEVSMRLQLSVRSLEMPLSELDDRLRIFEQSITETEHQRVVFADLLAGEKRRIMESLEGEAEQLRQKARSYLMGIVDECLEDGMSGLSTRISQSFEKGIPPFFNSELSRVSRLFNDKIIQSLGTFQKQADDLIETIRKTASELFNIPYEAPKSTEACAMNYRPYWVTEKWDTSTGSIPRSILYHILPGKVRRAQIKKNIASKVEALVLHNVENLRWAMIQNLNQAFLQFGSLLDERMQATVEATHGAINSLRVKRISQAESADIEVNRLKAYMQRLHTIGLRLNEIQRPTVQCQDLIKNRKFELQGNRA